MSSRSDADDLFWRSCVERLRVQFPGRSDLECVRNYSNDLVQSNNFDQLRSGHILSDYHRGRYSAYVDVCRLIHEFLKDQK